MQSSPSYLSKFLDGEMFHNWVKYMLQLFMWTPRLDKVVGAIASLVKVQNTRVALLKYSSLVLNALVRTYQPT